MSVPLAAAVKDLPSPMSDSSLSRSFLRDAVEPAALRCLLPAALPNPLSATR